MQHLTTSIPLGHLAFEEVTSVTTRGQIVAQIVARCRGDLLLSLRMWSWPNAAGH
jgi:hypothetical protein